MKVTSLLGSGGWLRLSVVLTGLIYGTWVEAGPRGGYFGGPGYWGDGNRGLGLHYPSHSHYSYGGFYSGYRPYYGGFHQGRYHSSYYGGGDGYYGGSYGGLSSYIPGTYFYGRSSSRIYPFSSSVDRRTASPGSTRTPLYVYEAPESGGVPGEREKSEGWRYLAVGDHWEASGTFAAMERQFPGSAWPKIGAGLLSGFAGDYETAEYRFRRAFRYDSEGPADLPEEPDLIGRLTRLADHYRGVMASGVADKDAGFMLAAVTYLSGDYADARNAIVSAISRGDLSRSAINLKRLVDKASLEAVEEGDARRRAAAEEARVEGRGVGLATTGD